MSFLKNQVGAGLAPAPKGFDVGGDSRTAQMVLFVRARQAVPNVGNRKGCPYRFSEFGAILELPLPIQTFKSFWAQHAEPLQFFFRRLKPAATNPYYVGALHESLKWFYL